MVSTPSAPDPYKTAAAQGSANQSAAVAGSIVNNMNQQGPYGTVQYKLAGYDKYKTLDANGKEVWTSAPRYTQVVKLNDQQQRLLNLQNQSSANLGELAKQQTAALQTHMSKNIDTRGLEKYKSINSGPSLQTTLNLTGLNSAPGGVTSRASSIDGSVNDYTGRIKDHLKSYVGSIQGQVPNNSANIKGIIPDYADQLMTSIGPRDYAAQRKQVEDAMFSRYASDYGDRRQSLQSELASRGLMEGSAAWNKAMDELNRERTDARYQAVLAGGQEQSRLAGLEMARGQFQNEAVGQQFGQTLAAAQFRNDAVGQKFGQDLAAGQFQNASAAQKQQQEMLSSQFRNQAIAQMYGQELGAAEFGNNAIMMKQQQDLASAQYKLQRGQALNAQELAAMEAKNNARQMEFDNKLTVADQNNQLRAAQLQELFALRNQPINEIAALMSGSQVNLPQVNPLYRQSIDPAPVADSVYRSYQMEAQNAQAGMTGLFGLGSSLLGALPWSKMLSDEREKENIEPLGETPGGHKVYAYDYKDGKSRGPSLFDLATGETKNVGVLAQEARKKDPKAVKKFGDRYFVDYSKIQ